MSKHTALSSFAYKGAHVEEGDQIEVDSDDVAALAAANRIEKKPDEKEVNHMKKEDDKKK